MGWVNSMKSCAAASNRMDGIPADGPGWFKTPPVSVPVVLLTQSWMTLPETSLNLQAQRSPARSPLQKAAVLRQLPVETSQTSEVHGLSSLQSASVQQPLSQASPIPSPSRSAWVEFATAGQLSQTSARPSASSSACDGLWVARQLSAPLQIPS